jgi:hypothetical protein
VAAPAGTATTAAASAVARPAPMILRIFLPPSLPLGVRSARL